MPTREDLKLRVVEEIDRRSEELVRLATTILDNAEPGFKEFKTSRLVQETFGRLGIPFEKELAITGVKGMLRGGAGEGPTVAVLGELDSLIVFQHPKADAQTGAAHACGHHAQIAMMLGVAMALQSEEVLPHLSGRVALMAVPAEEYIEIEERNELRQQGRLEFLGGKPEFIRLGAFDDVDMAMMTHTTSSPEYRSLAVSSTNNGTVAKLIQFVGKAAHAGGAPHRGINALNTAALALMAIHSQRETFRDEDTVRVHPIITKGGEAVNAVPADVRMETFVRGKTIEAIQGANEKVDRALRGAALAVGASVRITTLPGYLPLSQSEALYRIYTPNAEAAAGKENVARSPHSTGSTDMGDVSHIMPAIHPYAGGATGSGHGDDYLVEDYNLAVLNPCKAMAMTVVDLLAEGAAKAREIKADAKPAMTKEEYLAFMRAMNRQEEFSE